MITKSTVERMEELLLNKMGENRQVFISRAEIMQEAGIKRDSVRRGNGLLEASGRWSIQRGTGRDTGSLYTYLGD